LSIEIRKSKLIIDDLKFRKIAKQMKLNCFNSFGLILGAKQEGLIDNIRPVIERIRRTNFRFNKKLLKSILDQSRE